MRGVQRAADGKAGALDVALGGEEEGVGVRVEDLGRGLRSVHLLQGHDIGVEPLRVARQQVEVAGIADRQAARQFRIAEGAQRQPGEVPGGQLEFGRIGRGGEGKRENQQEKAHPGTVPAALVGG